MYFLVYQLMRTHYVHTHIQVKLLQHIQNTTAFREGISCQSTTHPSPPTPQAFARARTHTHTHTHTHTPTHTLSLSLWWVPAPSLPLVGAHTSQAMYTKHLIKTTVSVHWVGNGEIGCRGEWRLWCYHTSVVIVHSYPPPPLHPSPQWVVVGPYPMPERKWEAGREVKLFTLGDGGGGVGGERGEVIYP